MTNEEYEEYQRQKEEAKERVRQEAALLMNQLGQTYEALTSLLQQNPEMGREVTERTQADEEIYQKLRWNLERADEAPRCRWVKQDGTSCGSPQMRKHIYCYAHKQMMEARALALRLPALEDANAIQISLMRVQKALIDDTISAKKAGLLLYSLQLAVTNIGQTTFGEADERELVTDVVDEEEALGQNQGAPLIAGKPGQVNTDDTDKGGLPRMKVERVEVANLLAMRAGGAGWDKPTPNWDGLG